MSANYFVTDLWGHLGHWKWARMAKRVKFISSINPIIFITYSMHLQIENGSVFVHTLVFEQSLSICHPFCRVLSIPDVPGTVIQATQNSCNVFVVSKRRLIMKLARYPQTSGVLSPQIFCLMCFSMLIFLLLVLVCSFVLGYQFSQSLTQTWGLRRSVMKHLNNHTGAHCLTTLVMIRHILMHSPMPTAHGVLPMPFQAQKVQSKLLQKVQ